MDLKGDDEIYNKDLKENLFKILDLNGLCQN